MSLPSHSQPKTAIGLPGGLAPSRRTVDERRRFQRVVHVNGPAVRLEVRTASGRRVQGVCVDASFLGAAVRFTLAADPELLVGQSGKVVISMLRMPDLTLRARVVTSEAVSTGGRRYSFAFVDEDEVRQQITPAWARWFSRRRYVRVRPDEELGASLRLSWPNGQSRARLVDVSLGGVAIEVPLEQAHAIAVAREVNLLLAYPGSCGTMRLRASVRGATNIGLNVRLGLEYVRDAEYEHCRERLEAWTERLHARANAQLRVPGAPHP
jgi:hypothetical protein